MDDGNSNSERGLNRNVGLYPWFAALYNAFFWMPIFFLYFSAHLPLGEVLALEAVYYAGVVALEVPSGYFSDAVGRRSTLIISATSLVVAYLLFFVGGSFAAFAVAQIVLAGGIAFHSGTGTSFHFDSLAALGREESYKEREAVVSRYSLLATGLAAAVGGAVASVDLSYAYGLSAVTATAMLVVALLFREPDRHDREGAGALRFDDQLRACVSYLRDPALLWLFAFAVLMTVLNHLPYEFYQPYIDLVGQRISLDDQTPTATGLHMALTTMLGAWIAGRSASLDDRYGTGPVLLAAAAVQTAVIAIMGAVLHPVIVVLIFMRAAPKGLMMAPLKAAVTPRVPSAQRATYLSMQSLAGRLSFAVVLAGMARMAGGTSAESWSQLSTLLLAGAGIGVAGLLVLVASLGRVELGGATLRE